MYVYLEGMPGEQAVSSLANLHSTRVAETLTELPSLGHERTLKNPRHPRNTYAARLSTVLALADEIRRTPIGDFAIDWTYGRAVLRNAVSVQNLNLGRRMIL